MATTLETKYLKRPLEEISKKDMRKLINILKDQVRQRQSVKSLLKEIKRKARALDWGEEDSDDESDDKATEAVAKLEKLTPLVCEAREQIRAMDPDDVQQQWEDALKLTLQMAAILKEADLKARHLVDGSLGEWQAYGPDTAYQIELLWDDLATRETQPSRKWILNELFPKLKGCLGDYEDRLSESLDKIRSSCTNTGTGTGSNKRQKTLQTGTYQFYGC